MKALLLLPALVVLVLSLPATAAEPATKKEPATVAFVKKLYKAQDSDQGPLSENTMTSLSKWFDPSLSAVLFKAVSDDEMAIDFDPFYSGQDREITGLKIVQEVNHDDIEASVLVTFKNFGEPHSLRLHLSNTEHGWRVGNVIYETNDLRSIVSR
jgi:hypothetical protein